MKRTWVFLMLAMLLYLAVFAYLFAMQTGPICRDHPFRPHETVCDVERNNP